MDSAHTIETATTTIWNKTSSRHNPLSANFTTWVSSNHLRLTVNTNQAASLVFKTKNKRKPTQEMPSRRTLLLILMRITRTTRLRQFQKVLRILSHRSLNRTRQLAWYWKSCNKTKSKLIWSWIWFIRWRGQTWQPVLFRARAHSKSPWKTKHNKRMIEGCL